MYVQVYKQFLGQLPLILKVANVIIPILNMTVSPHTEVFLRLEKVVYMAPKHCFMMLLPFSHSKIET